MFSLQRGTNISHWLSQSKLDRNGRKAYIRRDDVARLAEMEFDHIRLPFDEAVMWHEDGSIDNEGFDYLQNAIDWCRAEGMKVVADLHILRTHYFNDPKEPLLFTDPFEQDRLAGLWCDISRQLSAWSPQLVAYEILNEPVARENESWNRVSTHVFKKIRELEPPRFIVLGSNRFSNAKTFLDLSIPQDEKAILTFHFYNPMFLTHYGASWWEGGIYGGPVHYPGKTVSDDDAAGLTEPLRGIVEKWNGHYDRNQMIEDIEQPLAVRKRTGLPLYCGEFGCIDLLPLPLRLAWYRDISGVFKELGIAWANWDYRGSFGLFSRLAGQDTGIAAALLGK